MTHGAKNSPLKENDTSGRLCGSWCLVEKKTCRGSKQEEISTRDLPYVADGVAPMFRVVSRQPLATTGARYWCTVGVDALSGSAGIEYSSAVRFLYRLEYSNATVWKVLQFTQTQPRGSKGSTMEPPGASRGKRRRREYQMEKRKQNVCDDHLALGDSVGRQGQFSSGWTYLGPLGGLARAKRDGFGFWSRFSHTFGKAGDVKLLPAWQSSLGGPHNLCELFGAFFGAVSSSPILSADPVVLLFNEIQKTRPAEIAIP
ncbi:hypothetical protein C8R43DRAFT_954332 [Mycena crocata]|nr:hypothetical protein C8R43DRAFT_954332 [Mycena crocata]